MPIRPENRNRYPKNWPEISKRIREEAGQKCEWCGVKNHSYVFRCIYEGRECYQTEDATLHDANTGELISDDSEYFELEPTGKDFAVKVILTVAHLDHIPENCERDNLRALCQRCHLNYDRHIHVRNRRENRLRQERARQPELFKT